MDKEAKKKSALKYYYKNKESYLNRNKVSRRRNKDRLNEYKKTLLCLDCQLSFKEEPYLCDFHHLENKVLALAHLCKSSWTRVEEELKKCIPLCCNCHRRRHIKEGYKCPSN